MQDNAALVLVDLQNDFFAGGAMPVPDAERIIPVVNRYVSCFSAAGRPVVFTRDWHPAESRHFQRGGGRWPQHCIQNTHGADFQARLRMPEGSIVLSKRREPDYDGYSGFDAVDEKGRKLPELLHAMDIEMVCIGGLATEFCVSATARDALAEGFAVTVLRDAVAGIDAGDSKRALKKIRELGGRLRSKENSGEQSGKCC